MDPRLTAANAAFARSRGDEAIDHIIAALSDGVPATAEIYVILLRNLVQHSRFAEGVAWGARAIALVPDNYDLLNFYGVCLRRTGRHADAIAMFDRAIGLQPQSPMALFNKGNVHLDLHDGPQGEAIFAELVRRDPGNAELRRSLGRALWMQRRHDQAAARMREAIALDHGHQDAWLDLSAILHGGGAIEASLEPLESALRANPSATRIMRAKALILRQLRRAEQCRDFLAEIAAPCDGLAWYHHELARLLGDTNRAQANVHHRRAVAIEPGNIDYRLACVESLDRSADGGEAANFSQAHDLVRAIPDDTPLTPDQQKVVIDILTRAADYDALARFGTVEQLGQLWAGSGRHTALLGLIPRTRTAADRTALLRAHCAWGDLAIAAANRDPITPPAFARPPGKIRLGFMSSDLREHPVSYFAWPLFAYADRDRFEIYCYSFYRGGVAGPLQRQLASMVDSFRWEPLISDRDAAQMIADDHLDILFELGGSTHMNRLAVMAWKPARSTASWLGYPHSAGLRTIDYLMVDPYLNPPDPNLLIEQPLLMPRSWIAMSERAFPDSHVIEPIAPFRRNGVVTFGTANNPYKYTPEMLRIWARVMAGIPGSRFIFVRPEGGAPIFVENIRARFEAEGIAGDRIDFRPVRGTHMPHYNEIDIALDTFPQTGGTTTCEAAWMGVPTVTLVGEAVFERMSYSVLQNAGLGDLCAGSTAEFIEIAVRLAGDPERIQMLRTGLRAQLKDCPLGQTRQFAQDFYDLVARTVAILPEPAEAG